MNEKILCPHCGSELGESFINKWKAKMVGKNTSEKKAASSAENGKKGGRPKKFEPEKPKPMSLDVIKDGKRRRLVLDSLGGAHYTLLVHYPDGQKVAARYQPEGGVFPDLYYLAEKNGFSIPEA